MLAPKLRAVARRALRTALPSPSASSDSVISISMSEAGRHTRRRSLGLDRRVPDRRASSSLADTLMAIGDGEAPIHPGAQLTGRHGVGTTQAAHVNDQTTVLGDFHEARRRDVAVLIGSHQRSSASTPASPMVAADEISAGTAGAAADRAELHGADAPSRSSQSRKRAAHDARCRSRHELRPRRVFA
jgi:hypothetical protein